MRRAAFIFSIIFFSCLSLQCQDTTYARQVIKFLTSKKCFGRGYVKNGLSIAAAYIAGELKQQNITPLFKGTYYQDFTFSVNTFPGNMNVKIDGHVLVPGKDYIVSPDCKGLSGTFALVKKDSVTFAAPSASLVISLKRKLTFSVAAAPANYSSIQLLNTDQYDSIKTVELNIENKLLTAYPNKNICAFIPGQKNNDSMTVFSAHYDHLGGLGKKIFFPGANDNASGVSMVLNIMRYYKAHPPVYKTLFIFFAGEEAGLLGSKYFTESKAIDLQKIKFLINLDLLGTGDDGIMVVNGAIHQKEFGLLTKINTENNLVKEIKKRGKASNSDHYWFSEAGVPCFFIYTMGGIKAYHDVFDVEKTLPLTDYADVFRLITAFVNQL
jgi:aminopeptidase YwaD